MITNQWMPFKNMNFTPQHDRYVCDTRDFHISAWERESEKNEIFDDYLQDWLKSEDIEKYMISPTEILNFLEDLFVWKFNKEILILTVEQKEFKGWLKYIRFKKITVDKYIVYTTSGQYYYPIAWEYIIED